MKIGIAGLSGQTQNYTKALQLAYDHLQCEPASDAKIPVMENLQIITSLSPADAALWDALVLPGGGDIDPQLLPGTPAPDPRCHDLNPALDRAQLRLLNLFLSRKKPVLGICKGMQLISISFGGDLIQHLPTADRHRYCGHDQLHFSHAQEDSFLAALYGVHFSINSAHHQGIRPDAPGYGLRIIQWADDGVPEALCHETLPIIGLQWHPERLCGTFARPGAVDGSLVFQFFFSLFCQAPGGQP